ncbi:MAG: molybdenum cofactor guanylyltransferase [Chloroflexi bacterium]|nr:molybdenum cofactor guanylyltransferase [Chloroflexota bacterium]
MRDGDLMESTRESTFISSTTGGSGRPGPRVSAAVMAGGKGVRLGADKALVELGGQSLLERALTVLGEVSDDLLVVGREGEFGRGVRAVVDARPGCGALGGIYTALLAARHDRCLVVATDMPFLNRELLAHIATLSADFDVVAPRLEEQPDTMHAAYSKACLEPIEELLDRGRYRITGFFDRVRVRYLDRDEVARFDPELRSLYNVNLPDELAQARSLLGGESAGAG